MSSPHESHTHESHNSGRWIDTWWPVLVILFGSLFISALVFFHPMH